MTTEKIVFLNNLSYKLLTQNARRLFFNYDF